MIEFRNEEIEKLQRSVAEKLGYRLVGHRLELYGVPLKSARKPSQAEQRGGDRRRPSAQREP